MHNLCTGCIGATAVRVSVRTLLLPELERCRPCIETEILEEKCITTQSTWDYFNVLSKVPSTVSISSKVWWHDEVDMVDC